MLFPLDFFPFFFDRWKNLFIFAFEIALTYSLY